MKKFDAAKFYAEFRTGLYGAGWTYHDVAVCHEHVEALEATVSAALNVFAVTEALRREPDPLTLELADELFGCFLSRAATDADHSWECAVCDEPVTMPNWITSKHADGCAVAKARDYLAQHAPHRTPGYTPSPRGALLDGDLAEQRKIHDQSLPQHGADK